MVNPHEPFVAEDGLVYEDLAAFLTDQPDKSWRNGQVLELRQRGRDEALIREWIKAYDGNEAPRTSAQEDADRTRRGNYAVGRRRLIDVAATDSLIRLF